MGNFAKDDAPERRVTVRDIESKHFSRAHLFTGTSRSRSGQLLQVARKQDLLPVCEYLEGNGESLVACGDCGDWYENESELT